MVPILLKERRLTDHNTIIALVANTLQLHQKENISNEILLNIYYYICHSPLALHLQ